MGWFIALVFPPLLFVLAAYTWTRVTTRDPAYPALTGMLLLLMYIGFVIGLATRSCL